MCIRDRLHSTALHCTVLYGTIRYCTVLYCTVLYCTELYCTVPYCTVLYCTPILGMRMVECDEWREVRTLTKHSSIHRPWYTFVPANPLPHVCFFFHPIHSTIVCAALLLQLPLFFVTQIAQSAPCKTISLSTGHLSEVPQSSISQSTTDFEDTVAVATTSDS